MYSVTIQKEPHHCPFSDVTMNCDVRLLHTCVQFNGSTENVWSHVSSERQEELQKSIQRLKAHPKIAKLEIVNLTKNLASIRLYVMSTKTIAPIILNGGCLVTPILALDGKEFWRAIFSTKSQLNKALNGIMKNYSLKVIEVLELDPMVFFNLVQNFEYVLSIISTINELSAKEKQLLMTAIKKGFYDEPKRINTIELANLFGVSKVAISRRIRRLERKLLPALWTLASRSNDVNMLTSNYIGIKGEIASRVEKNVEV
jgi:predicted DNA binding protein